jgi:hypothetical protein
METLGRAGSLADAAERVVALEAAVECVIVALKGYSPAPAMGE